MLLYEGIYFMNNKNSIVALIFVLVLISGIGFSVYSITKSNNQEVKGASETSSKKSNNGNGQDNNSDKTNNGKRDDKSNNGNGQNES